MCVVKNTLRVCKKGYHLLQKLRLSHLSSLLNRTQTRGWISFGSFGSSEKGTGKQVQTTLQQLSKFTEEEILKLHGMGKASLHKLRKVLTEQGLSFKTN